MVRGRVDRDVPAPEAGGGERHAEAPEVVALPLRVEDGPGRGEDALQPPRLDRQQAAEGWIGGLQRGHVVLARDGDARQIVQRGHVPRPDPHLVERAADVRRARVRPGHRLSQPGAQVRAPGDRVLLLQRRIEDRGPAHDMLLSTRLALESTAPLASLITSRLGRSSQVRGAPDRAFRVRGGVALGRRCFSGRVWSALAADRLPARP